MKNKFKRTKDLIVENPLLSTTNIEFDKIELLIKIENLLSDVSTKAKKKILFVSIELWQNLLRYCKPKEVIRFVIHRNSENVSILAEKIILKNEMHPIKIELDTLNALKSNIELKEYFKSKLLHCNLDSVQGIEFFHIKYKSDAELLYHFEEKNNERVLFSIIATITI